MDNFQQTMPAALKDGWLADLRANPDKQGKGRLMDDDGKFCCLGRLQIVAEGKVEQLKNLNGQLIPLKYPSWKWAEDHGLRSLRGSKNNEPERGDFSLPSLGFALVPCQNTHNGEPVACEPLSCAEANDGGYTFAQIADAIEKDVLGV
jgi:hypothetical protein